MNESLPNKSLLFSIIVPIYKTEAFLQKCIDSIIIQTYQNFEIILVDDGSPDTCPQICDENAQRDSRIHVIHKENGGAASARNAGIHAAHGDYIMFLDSDDYWNDITALQSISKIVIQYQCDVLCTNLYKTYIGKQKTKKYFAPSKPLIGAEKVLSCEHYISSPWSKVIKSQLLLNGQLDFVEGIGSEDIDWSFRVALLAKSIVYIDISFYCYLQRDTSSSHSMSTEKLRDLKNNVLTCIHLLQMQKDSMQKLLMPYISYQYAILLFNIAAVVDKQQQAIFLSGLQEKSNLLRHSSSQKVRAMNVFCKLLGFQKMMHLLSIYTRTAK